MKVINTYDSKSFSSKKEYKSLYKVLKNKITGYNSSKIEIEDIISMSKLARYNAVVDLMSGGHSHGAENRNIYYYFNPSDSLLEPVGREFAVNL